MNAVLVMAKRQYSDQPVRLFPADRRGRTAARQLARQLARAEASLTVEQAEAKRPPRAAGCLGPPGVIDRLLGFGLVEFVDGVPGEFELVR